MKNDFATTNGKGLLLLTTEDYNKYADALKNNLLSQAAVISSVCQCGDDAEVDIISLEPPMAKCLICGKQTDL